MRTEGIQSRDFRKATTGPHWRHAWALALAFGAADEKVDRQARELYRYRRDHQQDPQGTVARQPLLAAVEALQANAHLVEALQLLVLADATSDQMAQRTGLAEEVITLWQAMYFDVGNFRKFSVWMHELVTRAGETSPQLASRMRLAIGGGLVAVDDLLRAETHTPPAEAEQHQQRRLRLSVRVDEALDQLARTPGQHLALIKLNLQLRAADQRFELQRLELERRALQQQERQRQATLQQEIEQQPRPARSNRSLPCPGLDSLRWGVPTEATNHNDRRTELQSIPPPSTRPQEVTPQSLQPGDVLPYQQAADDESDQLEINASFAA